MTYQYEFDLLNESDITFTNWLKSKSIQDSRKEAIKKRLSHETSAFLFFNSIY